MFLDKHCRVAYFSAQYISLRNAGEPIFRVSFLAKKPALSGAEMWERWVAGPWMRSL
jgi:hypothetical protein